MGMTSKTAKPMANADRNDSSDRVSASSNASIDPATDPGEPSDCEQTAVLYVKGRGDHNNSEPLKP